MPDRLSAINPPALFAVSVDSGEKRPITTPPPDIYRDASPALSADGKTLAFARSQSLTVSDVFLQRVSPDLTPLGDPRRITEKSDFYIELAWAGDGTHILASTWRNGIWRIPLSGSAPQAVAGTDGAMMFSFSGSKNRLTFAHPQFDPDMWRLELSSKAAPVRFAHSTRGEYVPSISPDGRHVAFQSGRSGFAEIWLANSDGSDLLQLTSLKSFCGTPRWSPDAKTIAFESTADGTFAIWSVPVAGGKPRRLTKGPGQEVIPTWSRDGKWIYFGSRNGEESHVWKIPSGGGEPIRVVHESSVTAVEAPDGKTLYYAGPTANDISIWRKASDGRPDEIIVRNVLTAHSFDIVGDGIYFASLTEADGFRIGFHRFAARQTEWIHKVDGQLHNGLSVSPDRRWLLYSTWAFSSGDLMLVDSFR